jgi:hypothetical protein
MMAFRTRLEEMASLDSDGSLGYVQAAMANAMGEIMAAGFNYADIMIMQALA